VKFWICIPVHNRVNLTVKCLESLSKQRYRDFSTVICDDGSTDGTADIIAERFPDTILIKGEGNLWWTGATNRCVRYVLAHAVHPSDCIITLNNDLELPEDYLSSLSDAARRYPRSIIASVAYDIKTRRVVSVGYRQSWLTTKSKPVDPSKDYLPNDSAVVRVTHAAGRGTLIPLPIFQEIGLFDEKHLPHYGADYDFTHRARRAGHDVLVCLNARLFSHVDQTGLTKIRESFSLKNMYKYLTDRKSPANLKSRMWFALNNCPRPLIVSYLFLDILFVVGSYFKFHLLGDRTDRS
jgi:GT2 family glycosyltransferase